MVRFSKQCAFYAAASFCLMAPLAASTAISLKEEMAIQDHFKELSKEPGAVLFTPPAGWFLADPKALPPNVKVMVVGKARRSTLLRLT